jgi:EAL domain-containing protein (putative c-di-GMP-specific phosphodiesterase class I)
LIRVDNLSTINDHYGIDRGDKLLKLFVRLLHDYLVMHEIKDPVIGRYHGGDFIVGIASDERMAASLFDDFISTYKEIGGIGVEYRYVAIQNQKETKTDTLITYLYDSLTQPTGPLSKREKLSKERFDIGRLESEIVEAVENGKLVLSYLPAYHFGPERIDLLEIQVRLATENSGILPPKKFIPVINRLGLELRFDEQLFETICRQMVQIDPMIRCSFNLSPFALRSERFAQRLVEIAASYRLSPERVIIELFEHRPIKETIRYTLVLERLRSSGIRFALDNFGTQNAGFEYIKRLSVDMVRFDREFTISYNDPRISALFEGYMKMCKRLNIESLVKWVDDDATKERFRTLGVDYVQGFAVGEKVMEFDKLKQKYGVNR